MSLALSFLAGSSGFTAAGPAILAPRPQVQFASRSFVEVEMSAARRTQSLALGAALAATISVNAANAADPWPYSTLLSKVQGDEVAKVRALSTAPAPLPPRRFERAQAKRVAEPPSRARALSAHASDSPASLLCTPTLRAPDRARA